MLRPSPPDPPTFDFAALVAPLFTCVSARLVAQDQDQEVKERAIECVGAVVCRLGDLHAEVRPRRPPSPLLPRPSRRLPSGVDLTAASTVRL